MAKYAGLALLLIGTSIWRLQVGSPQSLRLIPLWQSAHWRFSPVGCW